ncbi:DUF6253 family protein [Kitasatospora sp. NPDC056783]|uniref:DUF6253 family protein n=1 Tax=Kitasatospora sp. NPDC056783 TaxID=3345943 RepID=UPI0036891893
MALLDAHGYEAVFGTPEGDTYRIPLVCWREDGDNLYGVVLIKGHPRRTDRLRDFLRYDGRHGSRGADATPAAFDSSAVDGGPGEMDLAVLPERHTPAGSPLATAHS